MVKQLFVINTDAFAASMADVHAGKLGFVTPGLGAQSVPETLVSGVIAGTSPVQVALKDLVSVAVGPGELVNAEVVDYNAGTAQVATVTTTGVAAGEEFYIKLMDVTIGTMAIPTKTFTESTAAKLAKAIDDEGDIEYSAWYGFAASNNAGVITITAPKDKVFRLASNKGAVIAYTVTPVYTHGTPAKVAKLEDECLTYEGFTNKVGFPVIRPATEVSGTATYDMLYCDFLLRKPTKDGSRVHSLEKIKLIFAVPAGNSTVTTATIKAQLENLAYYTKGAADTAISTAVAAGAQA